MAAHSYLNAYRLLGELRQAVNEYSSALWTGSDTSGKYTNDYLTGKLNAAQLRIYNIMMTNKDARKLFYKETSITGSSSVFTLPSDLGKIISFEDTNGVPVFSQGDRNAPVRTSTRADYVYYRRNRTLVLTKTSISDAYTLKYYALPRRLTWGVAAASSGLNTLILASGDMTSAVDDYYNYVQVDNYTQGKTGQITDYTGSTRSATTDGSITWVASTDYYGTVTELPEHVQHLIVPMAAILVRAEHPAAQSAAGQAELMLWQSMMQEALVWTGTNVVQDPRLAPERPEKG